MGIPGNDKSSSMGPFQLEQKEELELIRSEFDIGELY